MLRGPSRSTVSLFQGHGAPEGPGEDPGRRAGVRRHVARPVAVGAGSDQAARSTREIQAVEAVEPLAQPAGEGP